VKRINHYVRTILMTAYEVENHEELKNCVKENVINKFIQKPITIKELCQEVNNQVHAYQLVWNMKNY
jgi:response regulator RpfG family c-di-GMP phosphodiesterase